MRTSVNLQAVTDRVLSIVPPRGRARTGGPGRRERLVAMAMLCASGLSVIGGLGLWIAGHGMDGLRLVCGTVLLLLLVLRSL
jgi:hypothetical protein